MVASVPMEDIARMAALCMKDLDEEGEDDADLENDADLLVRGDLLGFRWDCSDLRLMA